MIIIILHADSQVLILSAVLILMDVDKLEKMLQAMTGQKDVKKYMRTIAHWTNMVKQKERLETADPKDMLTLSNLRELGIFSIETDSGSMTVTLTEEGKELSKDFFMKAYYVKG